MADRDDDMSFYPNYYVHGIEISPAHSLLSKNMFTKLAALEALPSTEWKSGGRRPAWQALELEKGLDRLHKALGYTVEFTVTATIFDLDSKGPGALIESVTFNHQPATLMPVETQATANAA
jgi:hypothetical protein